MSDKIEKFTVEEGVLLMKLEKEITKNMETSLRWCSNFQLIRDRRLYRRDYKSFGEYTEKKWNLGRRYVDILIEMGLVTKALPPEVRTMVLNPRQARAVVSVKPENRVAVIKRAAKKGPITAKAISEANREVLSESAPASPDQKVIELDRTGYPIPDKALKYWERDDEVRKLMQMVSQVKVSIEHAKKIDDLLYVEIRQSIIGDLNMIREALTYALPYAVCTGCNGQLVDRCTLCRGRGVISESLYKKVPSDIRAMREKMAKKGGSK